MKLRKRIRVVFLGVVLVGGVVCAPVKEVIVGRVVVIGNEPFTEVAVELSDGRVAYIEASPELEQILRSNQGRSVKLRIRERLHEGNKLRLSVVEVEAVDEENVPR